MFIKIHEKLLLYLSYGVYFIVNGSVLTFWAILDSFSRDVFQSLSVNLTNLVKIRKLGFLNEKVSLIEKIEVDLEQPL